MDLEYGIVCLLALVCVFISVMRCEKAERKAERLAERLDNTEASNERIFEAYRALKEKTDQLEEQIKELPTEQIREIYDSEKQFQDGLAAIMSFGQARYGLNKDGIKHE